MAPGSGDDPWILVVEEDDDVRQALADVLAFAGHRVRAAEDEGAATELLDEHGVSTVLVLEPRAAMGDVRGLLRAVRLLEEGRPVAVIALADSAGSGEPPAYFARLVKPFTMDELLDAVARAIAAHSPGAP